MKIRGLIFWCLLALLIFTTSAYAAESNSPEISVSSPSQGYTSYFEYVNFTFKPIDASEILWCKLWLNTSVAKINQNINNNTANYFRDVNITNGTYTWKVECMDTYTNRGNSSDPRTLTVAEDVSKPVIGNFNQTSDNMSGLSTFSFVPYDLESGLRECRIEVGEGEYTSKSTSVQNNSKLSFQFYLAEGDWIWNVSCTDRNNYTEWSGHMGHISEAEPGQINVTALSPENNSVLSYNDIEFKYYVSSIYPVVGCSLHINDSFDNQSTDIQTNSNNSINSVLKRGNLTWYVKCLNSGGYSARSKGAMNLTVDFVPLTTHLSISLKSPAHLSELITSNVSFVYDLSYAGELNACTLLIDGVARETSTIFFTNQSNKFSNVVVSPGALSWTVKCTNAAGATYAPSSRSLLIFAPDFISETEKPPAISGDIPFINESDMDFDEFLLSDEYPSIAWTLGLALLILAGSYITYIILNDEEARRYRRTLLRLIGKSLKRKTHNKMKNYVKTAIKQGHDKQYISEHLKSYGWKENHIKELLDDIEYEEKKNPRKTNKK
ncbi:MAG: hypothetical protein QF775_00300 [archaeon]|jgi:hypothetical protein|nr:hypothetical protein [Euryarchaeota archaeon]MDP6703910.1 hypothetical protein [archaeon]HIK01345.1 hypothetical protein [Candidatus Undinarchaeales archaeon ERR594346 U_76725]|tara:strand:+ start:54984 stop:56636 length:1653 start_codon:yes stop_codon:yes gene_type:complete